MVSVSPDVDREGLSLAQGYDYLSVFPITEWLNGYAPLPTAPGDQIRPRDIGTSATGGTFLAGWIGRTSAKSKFGRLRWSRWTETDANATGALWQDDCRPACVNGTYHATRAKVHLYRVNSAGVFSVMTVRARRHSFTLKAYQSNGIWYWN